MQLAQQPVRSGFVRPSRAVYEMTWPPFALRKSVRTFFRKGKAGHLCQRRPPRRGSVMLLCVFVIGLVSVMVLGLLKTLSVRSQVTQHIQSNEQLFYAAEAGLQHAVAKLEALPSFTGTIKWDTDSTKLPIDTPRLQYTVIVADTVDGRKRVTSRGSVGSDSTTLIRTLSGKGTL